MGYSAGFLNHLIQVQNRKAAQGSKYGLDGDGIEWENGDILHANVTFSKGVRAMNAGALDAYAVNIVRIRWTNKITMRSRVLYQRNTYQTKQRSNNLTDNCYGSAFKHTVSAFHISCVCPNQSIPIIAIHIRLRNALYDVKDDRQNDRQHQYDA